MKLINKILLFLLICWPVIHAQHLNGTVYELNKNQKKVPLPGVNILWEGTTTGTASDDQGNFRLPRTKDNSRLVVSYIGYKKDTISVPADMKDIEITLSVIRELDEVLVSAKAKSIIIKDAEPIFTQVMNRDELNKAACCNLSESFETNASVDVSYSDAITGAKKIKLLGLEGKYSQLMTEYIPNLRGIATTYGLGYVPGPWMESIQISKGTASVINGYESVAGQINIEYKKPEKSEQLHLNAFQNSNLRGDINANYAYNINENLGTKFFLHGSYFNENIDDNSDSFIDLPRIKQYNLFNRWKYRSPNWVAQFGISALGEERNGGQINVSSNPYKINVDTDRYQFYSKTGYIFDDLAGTSIGLINQITSHDQNSNIGINNYSSNQFTYYINLIFETAAYHKDHKLNFGFSFLYDDYDESLNSINLDRTEKVPGAFLQYTITPVEDLNIIAGIRSDFHNIHGTFYTPRFHVRFKPEETTTIRATVGKGFRTANVIAENTSLLASSRDLIFEDNLDIEEAWNFGINITKYFEIGGRDLTINADYYRTDFINQIVLDTDVDASKVFISNLDGDSFSNSYQIEMIYEVVKGLDMLVAFRVNDVKITLDDKLQSKPLLNKYKGMLSLSYLPKLRRWQGDITFQLNGGGRLPDTKSNPVEYQAREEYPAFVLINAQYTKKYKLWEFYVGVENLTNFTQDNPIIAANDPFGNFFDASMIWGPIDGRRIYGGFRFTLK